jgi:hypothetical protein
VVINTDKIEKTNASPNQGLIDGFRKRARNLVRRGVVF